MKLGTRVRGRAEHVLTLKNIDDVAASAQQLERRGERLESLGLELCCFHAAEELLRWEKELSQPV